MEQRDQPDLILGGADCAACGATVPGSRIRLLAERDDLVFAELACAICGSSSLAIVVRAAPTPDPVMAGPVRPPRPAVSPDDVLDMHEFLAAYDGDVRTLLGQDDAQHRNRRTRTPARRRP
jgi:hypothetical protein